MQKLSIRGRSGTDVEPVKDDLQFSSVVIVIAAMSRSGDHTMHEPLAPREVYPINGHSWL